MSNIYYVSAIGSLIFAMMGTRPDLTYDSMVSRYRHNFVKNRWNVVSSYMHNLGKDSWNAVKWIFFISKRKLWY